jgi:hypothetical protein
LSKLIFEFRSPLRQGAFKEIIPQIQPPLFILLKSINIAVYEDALGKHQVLGVLVNKQCALYELAAVKAAENASISKIENLPLEALAPYYALVGRLLTHLFAFIVIAALHSFTCTSGLLRPSASAFALSPEVSCRRPA